MRYNDLTNYWRELKDKTNNTCPINIDDLCNHLKKLNEENIEYDNDEEECDIQKMSICVCEREADRKRLRAREI